MATTDWLDPKWRHQLSNAVIAWIAVAILGGVGGLVWLVAHRSPTYLGVGMTVMAGALKQEFIPEINREGIKVEILLWNKSFPDAELQNVAGQFWVENKYLVATIRRTPSPLDHPWEKDGDHRVQYRIWYPVLVKTGHEWLPTLVLALPPPGETVHFGAQLVSKTTNFRQFRWTLKNEDGKPVISGGDATPSGLK